LALIIISILSLLLTVCYIIIVMFFLRGWIRIPYYRTGNTSPATRVSVLIAARNEEENIGFTLDDILAQDFPAELLEIIVVDDHSTDRTAEIVLSYKDRGVRLIKLEVDRALNSYKKKAIAEAIGVAKGEIIITTDADCRMKKNWLKTVVSFFEENDCKLVSAPVAYFKENSFFERLQTLEFLYLIGLGASSIGNKHPSTCNGANLAYRKDVFFELKGFQGIDDLASGDDELFLHKVALKYPEGIGFCKSSEAIVYTYAKPTLKEFISQRKRWASKSTRYKNKKIVALGVLVWLFNILILVNGILGIFSTYCMQVAVLILLLKSLVEMFFLIPVTRFAGRKQLMFYLPLLTVVHVLYIIYIGIAGNSGKYVWKERLVR